MRVEPEVEAHSLTAPGVFDRRNQLGVSGMSVVAVADDSVVQLPGIGGRRHAERMRAVIILDLVGIGQGRFQVRIADKRAGDAADLDRRVELIGVGALDTAAIGELDRADVGDQVVLDVNAGAPLRIRQVGQQRAARTEQPRCQVFDAQAGHGPPFTDRVFQRGVAGAQHLGGQETVRQGRIDGFGAVGGDGAAKGIVLIALAFEIEAGLELAIVAERADVVACQFVVEAAAGAQAAIARHVRVREGVGLGIPGVGIVLVLGVLPLHREDFVLDIALVVPGGGGGVIIEELARRVEGRGVGGHIAVGIHVDDVVIAAARAMADGEITFDHKVIVVVERVVGAGVARHCAEMHR